MKKRGTKLYLQDRTEAKSEKKESGHQMFLTFPREVLSILLIATSHRSYICYCPVCECNYHIFCGHYPFCIPTQGVFLGSVQSPVCCACFTEEDCIAARWCVLEAFYNQPQKVLNIWEHGQIFQLHGRDRKHFFSLSFSLTTELSNSTCLYAIGSIVERSWFIHTPKSF